MDAYASGYSKNRTATKTRWYVFLRWIVLGTIIGPGLVATYFHEGVSSNFIYDSILAAVALTTNSIFALLAHKGNPDRTRYFHLLAGAILLVDIVTVTLFMFNKGGIESRSIIMYCIPILMSAVLLGRRAVYVTAGAVLVVYHSMIYADYFGILKTLGGLTPELHTDTSYVAMSTVFTTCLILLVALTADFVSRVLLHEQLQTKQHYQALVRAQTLAHIGSWELELPSRTMIYSDEMCRLFGYPPDDGPPEPSVFISSVHPEDRPKVRRILKRLLVKKTAQNFDFRIYKDNDVRFMHGEVVNKVDSRGVVTRVFGIVQDVTDFYELDEAKHDFVSLASHQLRTPASVVKQYIGMLMDGYGGKLSRPQAKLAAAAYDGNERQLKLINNLLGVLKIDSGGARLKKQPTDIVALSLDTVAFCQQYFKVRNQTLTLDCRRKNLICNIDEGYIKIALENLIENASKYSADGSKVKVSLKRSGDQVKLSVKDSGIGIAERDIPKLFRKFSQLQNSLTTKADGNGLGLYWVHRIITLHHGHIEVRSRLRRGTTFDIYLPLK